MSEYQDVGFVGLGKSLFDLFGVVFGLLLLELQCKTSKKKTIVQMQCVKM